jgi:hypothetical protein
MVAGACARAHACGRARGCGRSCGVVYSPEARSTAGQEDASAAARLPGAAAAGLPGASAAGLPGSAAGLPGAAPSVRTERGPGSCCAACCGSCGGRAPGRTLEEAAPSGSAKAYSREVGGREAGRSGTRARGRAARSAYGECLGHGARRHRSGAFRGGGDSCSAADPGPSACSRAGRALVPRVHRVGGSPRAPHSGWRHGPHRRRCLFRPDLHELLGE